MSPSLLLLLLGWSDPGTPHPDRVMVVRREVRTMSIRSEVRTLVAPGRPA